MTQGTFSMKKTPPSPSKSDTPVVALEKTAKGSNRSMWELLLQLRVLLPYLARIVPLLEPLLDRPASRTPEFSDLSQTVNALQTGSRDLEVQARNQALQLERIEQHIAALREAMESNAQQTVTLAAQTHALGRRLTLLAASAVILLLGIAVMVGFLLAHTA
jgi:hypothetical protein